MTYSGNGLELQQINFIQHSHETAYNYGKLNLIKTQPWNGLQLRQINFNQHTAMKRPTTTVK